MIKVRLYTKERYIQEVMITSNIRKKDAILYDIDKFYALMHENNEPPFRDEESVHFLRETYNVEFVENDWYSVICDGKRRICLSRLNSDIKYALTLIYYSRKGKYLSFYYMDEKCWKVLSEMPFDILVAWNIDEIGIHFSCIEGASYVIENYPYMNNELPVKAVRFCDWPKRTDNYTRLKETDGCGPDYNLWIGEDGKYYTGGDFEIGYTFQYYWKNDISGIIHFCEEYKTTDYLVQVNQECNIFELGGLLNLSSGEYDVTLFSGYLSGLDNYKSMLEDSTITKDVFDEMVKELKEQACYQEYLFYLNDFKVIHHFIKKPACTTYRKLPILMVDMYDDGTYVVRGDLTVKYPEFTYIVMTMLEQRDEHRNTFCLFVDTDELLENVEDMDNTLYGLKITYNSLEIYDKEEAIKLFGAVLKEAYESGKCTVSEEFY
jgi:hypothetical protein